MASTPEMLFDFVRDMIYDPDHAKLDIQSLDEPFQDLGEGLAVLFQMLSEERRFAAALARGDMSVSPPSKDNELASSLKSLHASLLHITWQTQRIAEGDYTQKIDFMGDFAEAFNRMTRELATHKKLLEYEIEASQRKNAALENNIRLFTNLTEKIPQAILVLSADNEEILFANEAARIALRGDSELIDRFNELLTREMIYGEIDLSKHEAATVSTGDGDLRRYYSIDMHGIQWSTAEAFAFVAEDVTDEVLRTQRLEQLANVDELTKLYVRRYGMEVCERWISERRPFSICFVDLDFLKYVNDTFGHEMGDAYIKTAADLLRGISPGVVASRLGGDEFMLLVPDKDEAEIESLMDGVQEALRRAPEDIDTDPDTRSKLKFHASFGIVRVPTDGTADQSALLAEADEKMYSYKKAHKAARTI